MEFTRDEKRVLFALNTPIKIQDYLNTLPKNFEHSGITLRSPRRVLLVKEAHCIEGALLAALALWYHGEHPFLLDLVSTDYDFDHVVTLFKVDGHWGAISKTNHIVLRYREPVYKSVRELAMSYFHEYFLDNGKKTLRAYSNPFDLSLLPDTSWVTSTQDLWWLSEALDKSIHHKILTPFMIRRLRLADKIERQAGKLHEW
ncbi:MAG: hypothetical protein A2749_00285 [Parcubacteria group bacterium RIFCSPHIGHO2_01_FULL_45_26]|nr:MAG: hypothetical protein A2749_00285 [Parcubacteria group bacterium RIFCSPHIGHO2_01_FULL_45_26]